MNLQEKIQERMRRVALAEAWKASADQLTSEIDDMARQWLAKEGARPSWSVPEVADVVLPLSKPAVVITDIDALRSWTEVEHPDNIRTVEEVRPAFQKWLIENGVGQPDGRVLHPETHQPIPGLTARKGGVPGSLRFTPDPTARALLASYAEREVAAQLAAEYGPQESSVSDPDGASGEESTDVVA